jgi:hypothetical protein
MKLTSARLPGYRRAVKADERDILAHGVAAQGQIVEIRSLEGGRYNHWVVTVEFTVPDRTEPVHFQVTRPESIGGMPKEFRNLREGQQIAIGAALKAALVGPEDAAFAGGSYVIIQKYLHEVTRWNTLSTEEQERIIGRKKLSDIELSDAVKPGCWISAVW